MEKIIYALIFSNILSISFLAAALFMLIDKREKEDSDSTCWDRIYPETTTSTSFPTFSSETAITTIDKPVKKETRGRPRKGTVKRLNSI